MKLGSEELYIIRNQVIQPYCGKAIEGACLEVSIGELRSLCSTELYGFIKAGMGDRSTPRSIPEPPDRECVMGEEGWILNPWQYYLLVTAESVHVPTDLIGTVAPRSTLLRSGIIVEHTTVSPGWNGKLTFGIANLSRNIFWLSVGARIAGIELEELKNQSSDAAYAGQSQGGRVSCAGPEKQV